MKWSDGSRGRAGRRKRARMSSTGRTWPRTLTTPSMTAGALGSGVIVTARTSSRTSAVGRPYALALDLEDEDLARARPLLRKNAGQPSALGWMRRRRRW